MDDRRSHLRSLLRSPLAAALWSAAAAWCFVIYWQGIVGWPLTTRSPVVLTTGENPTAGVLEGHIKSGFYRRPWSRALVRIWADGLELPQYGSAETLRSAASSGSRVHGHNVTVRLVGRAADAKPPVCLAQLPWHATPEQMAWGAVALAVLTAALLWAGNPWLLALGRRAGRVPWVALLFGLALAAAILLRTTGLTFPVWAPDTADYIRPALQFNNGMPVTPTERSLGYAVVLGAVLRVWHDLRAIVLLQHLGTVFAGVTIAAMIWLSSRRLFERGWARQLAQLAGVTGMAVYTLHEAILERDWNILPEAWCAVYMAAQLWLGWRFVTKLLPRWRLFAEYAVYCALGWWAFLSRPNWGLALGLMTLPLLTLALLRGRRRESGALIAGGLGVFAAVALVAYWLVGLTPENTKLALHTRAKVLVCWHLDLVRPEIDRRLAAKPPENERLVLEDLAKVLDWERQLTRERGPGAYQLLGHDGDRIYYYLLPYAEHFQQLEAAQQTEFCTNLFRGALRRDPMVYARKVGREMRTLLVHPYDRGLLYLPAVLDSAEGSTHVAKVPPDYFQEPMRSRLGETMARATAVLRGPWPSPARAQLSDRVGPVMSVLTDLLAWAVWLPVLVTIAAALWPAWRRRIDWRTVAPVLQTAIWATGSVLASALTSSLAQSLEIQRYVDFFMPLTLLSELLWPLIACSLLAAAASKRDWGAE